jgi:hypothetical protein
MTFSVSFSLTSNLGLFLSCLQIDLPNKPMDGVQELWMHRGSLAQLHSIHSTVL